MNHHIEEASDDGINLAVYIGLLCLTGLTLAAGLLGKEGRILAISIALIIAGVKGSLIGFYYMGLRKEKAITWIVLAVGVVAVGILIVGIFPDMTFRRL